VSRDVDARTASRAGPALLRRMNARGFRLLQVADAVALVAVMAGLNLVRFGTAWPTYSLRLYAVGFAVAAGIHLVVYYFGGLYEPEQRLGVRPLLPRIAFLTGVAVLIVAAVLLVVGRYPGGRITLDGVDILQPTKKPRGHKLTRAQKAGNRQLARRRVRIEHVNSSVKRCRMLKETIRVWKAGIRDMVMEIGCALHNFRVRLTPSWTPMV
jgi:zinc transporter ZupT